MTENIIDPEIQASNSAGKIIIRTTDGEIGLLVADNGKIVNAVWMKKEDVSRMIGKLQSVL